jgi:hypothetical protein
MVIRGSFLIIAIIACTSMCRSQDNLPNATDARIANKKAQKIKQKFFARTHSPSSKNWMFIAVPNYKLSSSAEALQEPTDLLKFVEFDLHQPVSYIFFFDEGEYSGVLDVQAGLYFSPLFKSNSISGTESFGLLDSLDQNFTFSETWEMLSARKTEHLFTIRDFSDLLWFREESKFFVIHIKKLKLEEANSYIKANFSAQEIRNRVKQ